MMGDDDGNGARATRTVTDFTSLYQQVASIKTQAASYLYLLEITDLV